MSKPVKLPPAPECPAYLAGALRERWDQLAPKLAASGMLEDSNADLLAKYILAENEYLRVSGFVQDALNVKDGDEANKWLAAQDRLTKQILALGGELGLTPRSRRARGITIR